MIILAILLLFLSIYIIYFNWRSFYVQIILDEPYSSMIPFVGGTLLFFSSFIIFNGSYKYFSILSFFLDYGSLIFIFHNFITKNNKNSLSILGLNISLISKNKKNKQLIYEHLNKFKNSDLEILFYNIFDKNKKNYFIKYELSDCEYHNNLLANEINTFFCKFNSLQIGPYYLNKKNIDDTIYNNDSKKIKIGYFLIKDNNEKKSLFLAEKKLILEDWNQNIFTELLCTILLKKYKYLNQNIIINEIT